MLVATDFFSFVELVLLTGSQLETGNSFPDATLDFVAKVEKLFEIEFCSAFDANSEDWRLRVDRPESPTAIVCASLVEVASGLEFFSDLVAFVAAGVEAAFAVDSCAELEARIKAWAITVDKSDPLETPDGVLLAGVVCESHFSGVPEFVEVEESGAGDTVAVENFRACGSNAAA